MADIATRASYGRALADLGEKYMFAVMDADLSGSTQTKKFAEKFPERFINCGIAEQNMIGVAAGIAATGMPVFASSFAMFASGRAYEQIRNSVGHTKLNVKICASHAGVTVGEDGATHQFCEDIAIMRSIPGMVVISPADDTEAYAAKEAILKYDGPVYCRLGRQAVPVVFDPATYKFELFKAVPLTQGDDCAVFAHGVMIDRALKACELLKTKGINISVIDTHTIKPLDEKTVLEYAARTRNVVVVEEHSVIGGLGGAICELLSQKLPTPVTRLGINDVFGVSGKAGELLDYYGLSVDGIADAIRNSVKNKDGAQK